MTELTDHYRWSSGQGEGHTSTVAQWYNIGPTAVRIWIRICVTAVFLCEDEDIAQWLEPSAQDLLMLSAHLL